VSGIDQLNLKQMIEMQQTMLSQFSVLLESLGIKMYLSKIDIEPRDCPELCIDYVWRIECTDKEVCRKLKEKLLEDMNQ